MRAALLALFILLALPGWAEDGYSVNNGALKVISEHGVCRRVTNSLAGTLGLYVPTKFNTEWSVGSNAFINNVISGVTLAACLEAASLRFKGSQYLSRTPAAAGNQQKWTWSGWLKRSNVGTQQTVFEASPGNGSDREMIVFNSAGQLHLGHYSGGWTYVKASTAMYRDTGAWMHIVVAVDSTQATGGLRNRIYVNGSEITSWSSSTDMALNRSTNMNSTKPHVLGRAGTAAEFVEGYLADVYLVDGQQLTPSDFAETDAVTGQWVPKAYTGTYGTNGFHLTFSNPASLGADVSGNGNTWTPNNFSTTAGTTYDPMRDYPSGSLGGNYPTFDPFSGDSTVTLSEGNLKTTALSNVAQAGVQRYANVGVKSGKWYWECTNVLQGSVGTVVGATNDNITTTGAAGQRGWWSYTGDKWNIGSTTAYGSTWTTNDIASVALDVDSGKIWFAKNGTWQASGNPAAGTNAAFTDLAAGNGPWFPFVRNTQGTVGSQIACNFGQRAFSYTPPSGFVALNTYNMPSPTIVTPTAYFKAVTYTGTGAAQTINVGFQPDLVWIKSRSAATDHAVYDSVRGVQKDLVTNSAGIETTQAQGLTAFTSTGFTIGTLAKVNTNGATYVAWAWKKGATPGFDVITYTGTGSGINLSHSLGAVPAFFMVKRLTGASGSLNWTGYHWGMSSPETKAIFLNLLDAPATGVAAWDSTAPTSSIIRIGTSTNVNNSGDKYVVYAFAEVPGLSKFGSYTGNGSTTDGTFVYTGFKPAFVLVKRLNPGYGWGIFDNGRNPSNPVNYLGSAQSNVADYTDLMKVDFLANGFKWRSNQTSENDSGATYIYAAFAEAPFQYANAR